MMSFPSLQDEQTVHLIFYCKDFTQGYADDMIKSIFTPKIDSFVEIFTIISHYYNSSVDTSNAIDKNNP